MFSMKTFHTELPLAVKLNTLGTLFHGKERTGSLPVRWQHADKFKL